MAERYQIQEKLAGKDGLLYRGFDNQLKRDVAIKRLLPEAASELIEQGTGFLLEEASILARFQHPNVVTIFGFEEDEKGPFVVTELIKGENLEATVNLGAFALEDFQEFVSQTLDAMIGAEQKNLLHGEINPSNLLLSLLPSGKFHVKILNFGLAKFSRSSSEAATDSGLIEYRSPEHLAGEALDQRSDLYSLGCVCYFALTQSPPFESEEIRDVTPISEYRPDLPTAIAAWVMRMIAADRDNRPENATTADREFEQAKIGIAP